LAARSVDLHPAHAWICLGGMLHRYPSSGASFKSPETRTVLTLATTHGHLDDSSQFLARSRDARPSVRTSTKRKNVTRARQWRAERSSTSTSESIRYISAMSTQDMGNQFFSIPTLSCADGISIASGDPHSRCWCSYHTIPYRDTMPASRDRSSLTLSVLVTQK